MANPVQHAPVHPKRIPWYRDIYRGAFKGDWAELGLLGYVTQAGLGIVPLVGSMCAFRDFLACRHKKDTIGSVLNGVALIPFIGFFPKTAAVIRVSLSMGNTSVLAKNLGERTMHILPHHDYDAPDQLQHS